MSSRSCQTPMAIDLHWTKGQCSRSWSTSSDPVQLLLDKSKAIHNKTWLPPICQKKKKKKERKKFNTIHFMCFLDKQLKNKWHALLIHVSDFSSNITSLQKLRNISSYTFSLHHLTYNNIPSFQMNNTCFLPLRIIFRRTGTMYM